MAFKSSSIDPSCVEMPKIYFTKRAYSQLKLIQDNDYTLQGKVFRILISGKGCDGFHYSAGFTLPKEDDLTVQAHVEENGPTITLHMDLFAAFYTPECSVDFIQDFTQDAEGFVIVNHIGDNFAGKFWKKDQQRIPELLDEGPFSS
jgi:iron-sulfur cluster insertion protein